MWFRCGTMSVFNFTLINFIWLLSRIDSHACLTFSQPARFILNMHWSVHLAYKSESESEWEFIYFCRASNEQNTKQDTKMRLVHIERWDDINALLLVFQTQTIYKWEAGSKVDVALIAVMTFGHESPVAGGGPVAAHCCMLPRSFTTFKFSSLQTSSLTCNSYYMQQSYYYINTNI